MHKNAQKFPTIVEEALRSIPSNGTEYVFFNHKTGKPLTSVKKAFKNAVKKADIHDFRFHDLRHTFASHLVMNGVSLYVVMKLLGHSNMKVTERYAHLKPDQLKDAVGTFDDFLSHNPATKANLTENNKKDNFIKHIDSETCKRKPASLDVARDERCTRRNISRISCPHSSVFATRIGESDALFGGGRAPDS